MRVALYQPDIAQNAGTILRLCACMGVAADIIEPAGFPASERAFRRAGMDYLETVALTRHGSFAAFQQWRKDAGMPRLVLATTSARLAYTDFVFARDDIVLLGRESAGVPQNVHLACDAHITIPMVKNLRSINVALAAAMILGEALRQTTGFARMGDGSDEQQRSGRQ